MSILREIVAEAAERHDVTPADVMGVSIRQECVLPRHEVMLALRERGWSYPRIGRALHRDPSTVIAGIKAAKRRTAEAT